MTDIAIERLAKRTPDIENSFFISFIFVMKEMRGNNLGSRAIRSLCEYLKEKKDISLFTIFISGVKLIQGI